MRAIKKVSHWDFHPKVRSGDQRTFGEKSADVMRRSMGSWFLLLYGSLDVVQRILKQAF